MKLETPEYNLHGFGDVYEPREDTFLFLDALESELSDIVKMKPTAIAEIGSGSGVVITALAKILKSGCAYFATDLNSRACRATLETARLNNVVVECLNMNLLDEFKGGMFDVVLFNPPYVVTASEEMAGNGLNRAWAGGSEGRESINLVLQDLDRLLSEKGVCYMVILKENKPLKIVDFMSSRGYKCSNVMQRKIPGEHLFVFRFNK